MKFDLTRPHAVGASYGLLALPLSFVALPMYVNLPHVYATQFAVPLTTLGLVLLLSRLLDAFIDPWMGRISDVLYGGPLDPRCTHQALHAWRLQLIHPDRGETIGWSVEPPEDMMALIRASGIDLLACLNGAIAREPWANED